MSCIFFFPQSWRCSGDCYRFLPDKSNFRAWNECSNGRFSHVAVCESILCMQSERTSTPASGGFVLQERWVKDDQRKDLNEKRWQQHRQPKKSRHERMSRIMRRDRCWESEWRLTTPKQRSTHLSGQKTSERERLWLTDHPTAALHIKRKLVISFDLRYTYFQQPNRSNSSCRLIMSGMCVLHTHDMHNFHREKGIPFLVSIKTRCAQERDQEKGSQGRVMKGERTRKERKRESCWRSSGQHDLSFKRSTCPPVVVWVCDCRCFLPCFAVNPSLQGNRFSRVTRERRRRTRRRRWQSGGRPVRKLLSRRLRSFHSESF